MGENNGLPRQRRRQRESNVTLDRDAVNGERLTMLLRRRGGHASHIQRRYTIVLCSQLTRYAHYL